MVNARATDPITSKLAGHEVEAEGTAGIQRILCLQLLASHPGATTNELATHSELDRYQIARRLPELRERGLVRNTGVRPCAVSGRLAMTWEIVDVDQ